MTEHYFTVPLDLRAPAPLAPVHRTAVAAAAAGRGRLEPPYLLRVTVFREHRPWPAAFADEWLAEALGGLADAGVITGKSDVIRVELVATSTVNPQRAHVQVRSLADHHRP